MKCIVCQKEIKNPEIEILEGCFVCDNDCKKNFEKEMKDFFNRIIVNQLPRTQGSGLES
jgi:hypothetical protein